MEDQGAPDPGGSPAAPVVEWAAQPASPPPVAWAPPPPEALGISIGGVLRDTFARYAADPIRLFLVGLIPSVLVLFVSNAAGPALLVTILSLIGTAIVMVLGDRGRASPLRAAVGLGLRRVLWLWLVSFLIVAIVGLLAIVPVLIISLAVKSSPGLLLVLLLVLAIPLLWVYMRLVLALPAVVIDDIGANDAFDRSRAATKGLSVAVQVFAIIFITGLASFPVGLAAGALLLVDVVPPAVVLLVGGLLAAFVAPVSPLAFVSMYRRVYPRYEEPVLAPAIDETQLAPVAIAPLRGPRSMWDGAPTEAADLVVPPPPPVTRPVPQALTVPPYGSLARGLVGATLTLGIAGVVAFVWVLGAVASGALAGATGNVPRGTILFGPAASIQTCSVSDPFTEMPRGGSLTWMGSFTHRTAASDRIRLVVTFDGVEAADVAQPSGVFDCLGSDVPETDLSPGVYKLTLLVNDQASATGTFTAR